MNIFASSSCAAACARHLDDKRVAKLALEAGQMVCSGLRYRGMIPPAGPRLHHSDPYGDSHKGHPIHDWIADDENNLLWLYQHGIELCREYAFRFPDRPVLKVMDMLVRLPLPIDAYAKPSSFFNGARNKSINLDFTMYPVHEAYRMYLNARWPGDVRFPRWTNRQKPEWALI